MSVSTLWRVYVFSMQLVFLFTDSPNETTNSNQLKSVSFSLSIHPYTRQRSASRQVGWKCDDYDPFEYLKIKSDFVGIAHVRL